MTFPVSKSISYMSFVPFKAIDYPMAKLILCQNLIKLCQYVLLMAFTYIYAIKD